MSYKEKSPQDRVVEMLRVGTSLSHIVKRLCSEFKESFWVQGNAVMMEYIDAAGRPQRRCIYNSYS